MLSDELVQGSTATTADLEAGNDRITFNERFAVVPTDMQQAKTDSKFAWSVKQREAKKCRVED